jgi:hypothetical protein
MFDKTTTQSIHAAMVAANWIGAFARAIAPPPSCDAANAAARAGFVTPGDFMVSFNPKENGDYTIAALVDDILSVMMPPEVVTEDSILDLLVDKLEINLESKARISKGLGSNEKLKDLAYKPDLDPDDSEQEEVLRVCEYIASLYGKDSPRYFIKANYAKSETVMDIVRLLVKHIKDGQPT